MNTDSNLDDTPIEEDEQAEEKKQDKSDNLLQNKF